MKIDTSNTSKVGDYNLIIKGDLEMIETSILLNKKSELSTENYDKLVMNATKYTDKFEVRIINCLDANII